MLRLDLKPKPDEAPSQVSCEMSRRDGLLHLDFKISCNEILEDVASTNKLGAFTDNLWHSTCIELFVAQSRSTNYLEWNFAADGRFAIYYFKDIRQRETLSDDILSALRPIRFSSQAHVPDLKLQVELPLQAIHDVVGHPEWHLQPAVVLKPRVGNLTYWAVSHPGSDPNFHCFAHLPTHDPYTWVTP